MMDPFLRFKRENARGVLPELMESTEYNIVPTMAFSQHVQVYALAASFNMRYLFTGGEDGLVRKYDFQASLNGQGIHMSQRQMQIDTITKSGVLCAYWENEQPLKKEEYKVDADGTYLPKVSPVYSLQAQSQALWVCAGMASGDICFQSATYGDIGKCMATLSHHTKPVSDMHLNGAERMLLSGSWDKSVALWDLNRSSPTSVYDKLSGQVSTVRWQPVNGPSISSDSDEMDSLFGSDNDETEDNSGEPATDAKDPSSTDEYESETSTTFLASTMNGTIHICDTKQPLPAASITNSQAPPWCMSSCWSTDGTYIYAGRRNSTVDWYDIRKLDEPMKVLKFPNNSGAISCVEIMPNNRSLLCASFDNIRLFDVSPNAESKTKKTPFSIIPGHHGCVVSRIAVCPDNKCFVSACGGRGWMDTQVDYVLGYEVTSEI
ncbi:SAGA complex subunit [Starmerella bacillaris]|uniref:SAGA complex subunit n=1 Tax=Starmerella bacillaris TaxID=1247836 RepID=A0AAV5RMT2_STABA|nr:SAGA complex subunit [Starmerella bacillaris]